MRGRQTIIGPLNELGNGRYSIPRNVAMVCHGIQPGAGATKVLWARRHLIMSSADLLAADCLDWRTS